MEQIKESILNHLLFLLSNIKYGDQGMNHIVITGPPGAGKTTLARILGELYHDIGSLSTDNFIVAKNTDLVGKYCGHTAANTRDMFEKARHGVILIDEITNIGSGGEGPHNDVFSHQCIDTINQCLSEMKNDILCIICGYADRIEKDFFSYNKGLERRFPYRYNIKTYNASDLRKIFIHIIERNGWFIDESILTESLFSDKSIFRNNGGSIELLFDKCRNSYIHRNFCKPTIKPTIEIIDINYAINCLKNECMVDHRNLSPPVGMYL